MCGIAGILSFECVSKTIDIAELVRVRDYMSARGPDGKGLWVSNEHNVGLAHRRLSIIDLSDAASQPMASDNNRFTITYNGEIYNHKALRNMLEKRGYKFSTSSDTEVLLHLYQESGPQMVHELRGMFAFAIWDNSKKEMFLARDHLGIKPLYYSTASNTLRFASQVKALMAGGKLSRELDPAGLTGFYLFGSVPEPFTIYRDIQALPAGSTLTVKSNGECELNSYFKISSAYCGIESNTDYLDDSVALQKHVRGALLDSVSHHLVSDVPVGAFLSAGIDSGALVGLMRDAGQVDIQTILLSFDEFCGTENDETYLAEKTAKHYNTNHTTRVVTRTEFDADLPLILEAMDQPSIDGVNSWFVSKAANEAGLKVAISGLGGDELFGGYSLFKTLPKWVSRISGPSRIPLLGSGLRKLAVLIGIEKFGISPKAAGLVEYAGNYPGAWLISRGLFMPWEIANLLGSELAAEGLKRLQPIGLLKECLNPEPESNFGKIASLESSFYMCNQLLRDADWSSMAHSLEVRVPLVDQLLLQKIAILNRKSTVVTKEILARSPIRALPDEVIYRKKTGFSIPVEQWLNPPSLAEENTLGKAGGSWSRRWAKSVIEQFPSRGS